MREIKFPAASRRPGSRPAGFKRGSSACRSYADEPRKLHVVELARGSRHHSPRRPRSYPEATYAWVYDVSLARSQRRYASGIFLYNSVLCVDMQRRAGVEDRFNSRAIFLSGFGLLTRQVFEWETLWYIDIMVAMEVIWTIF